MKDNCAPAGPPTDEKSSSLGKADAEGQRPRRHWHREGSLLSDTQRVEGEQFYISMMDVEAQLESCPRSVADTRILSPKNVEMTEEIELPN